MSPAEVSPARDEVRQRVLDLRAALKKHVPDADTYRPVRDRVLLLPLRRDGEEQDPETGLYLPDEGRHASYNHATVIAVGPGSVDKRGVRRPLDVEPDDVVIVGSHSGLPLEIAGVEFRLVKGGDVMAIV